jgi:TonB-linked SusC/RagA family outer membrane protein
MKLLYLLYFTAFPLFAFCQVTGTIKDEHNVPLQGITVTVKGTNIATISNDQGQFELKISQKTAMIRFTATNVDPLEIEWAGQKDLKIELNTRINKLDEVQIIAYGSNTQRFNVGSISKVTADDINKQAATNPLSALEGMVPGLVITPTSGIPGSSFNVQIRGQNTLNSTRSFINPQDNPLYIIDGVPFAPQNGNVNQFSSLAAPGIGGTFNNPYGGISPFNSIDPADIESIEVLRDADATAIYGSRGGNGVILITTKKGKAGKTEFNINVRNGVSFIGPTMPMMNTQQYVAMREEAFKNDGLTPNTTLYDPAYAPDLLVFDTTRYTDWKKVFFGNTAHNTNATASVSGGNKDTQFHLGAGFNQDTYIFPGNYADNRANFSASIHHSSPNKKFTIDFSSNYSYDKNNSSNSPNLLLAYTLEPDYPSLLDDRGNLVWNYKGVPLDGSQGGYNPFAYLKETYSIQNINLNSNLLLGYKIINGLTLRTSLGYNTFNSQEYTGNPVSAQNPAFNPVATAGFGTNNYSTWIIEPQLEYKGGSKKATYSILVGSTFQKNSDARTTINAFGYINDALINSISGAPTTKAIDAFSEYKYAALFGRINYRWDNKYIIDINGRRDGSSRFGPEKQFGNFGSIGGGWLFNEESFVKNNLSFLSYGKLKGSYGITGSDAVADYQYISRYAPTALSYQGNIGYLPQNLYNPQLSWATTRKLEFGLELGFFQDRLLFNSTWYRDRSGNQLVTYQLPSQTGFSTVYENLNALVQNSGVELSLQSTIIKNKGFSWTSSFNITIPRNKLLAFPGIETSSYSTTYIVGQSLNVIKGFKYAGVNSQTGLFQFLTASGQVTDNPTPSGNGLLNDFYNLGTTDPKFYGGFQNSFNYKGIQLDLFLTFKKQLGYNYLYSVYSYLPGLELNQPVALLNRWQKPGQRTNIQQFSSQYNDAFNEGSNFFQSSGVYSDASYIRLKTLSLSYNIPAKYIQRFGVQALRIYVTGQNIFTITNYKGNDPETQNFYGVPPLKSIILGLQLTF